MLRHKVTDNISPTSRVIIVVVGVLAALAVLIFMLTRPPSTHLQLEPPGPFGSPGAIPPAESTK